MDEAEEQSFQMFWLGSNGPVVCPPTRESFGQVAVDAAKAQRGRWERDSPVVIFALLDPDGDGYKLDARAESGAVIMARYDARTGLSWPETKPALAG